MKTMRSSFQICRQPRGLSGFTFTEMLVVIAVLGVLGSLFLALATGGASKTKRAQCAANLRQFNQAMQMFGNENDGRLTTGSPIGNWAWDLPSATGDFVEATGSKWTTMFCPGTAPLFTEQDNWTLYNWTASFRVTGYAITFPGNSLTSTNRNDTLFPQRLEISPGVFVTPSPAERVLLADATISDYGQIATALKYSPSYRYTYILGGYIKPHLTPHLKGRFPAGGNVSMLDGHVKWRGFDQMVSRTTGGGPGFWW
jgi:prepilin-type N-terminal cleavage/methylation domain-containing protein/prepilin-type processing-associated H-X9-DG protein